MKKLIILLYLLLPCIVSAETIYTDYEPYLLDQTSHIKTNDLISEEEITKYVHLQETINKEEYYYKDNHPENMKIVSNEVIIESRRQLMNSENNSVNVNMINILPMTNIFEFEFINSNSKLNFVLFDKDNKLISYHQVDNIINLSRDVEDLHILFIDNEPQNITIKIAEKYFDFTIDNRELTEIHLTPNIIYNLSMLGIYTSYQFSNWTYYANYSLKFKYQEILSEEIIDNNKENSVREIKQYNYYKRDRVNFKKYLELNKQRNNLYEYITDSTINIDEIKYEGNIDYTKNGIYEITYKFSNKKVMKPVYILNEETTIIDNNSCEFEYQNTFTYEPNIVYVEYPVIYEKEIIKYKQLNVINKDNTSSKIDNKKEVKQSSMIILAMSFLIALIIKMVKKKQH